MAAFSNTTKIQNVEFVEYTAWQPWYYVTNLSLAWHKPHFWWAKSVLLHWKLLASTTLQLYTELREGNCRLWQCLAIYTINILSLLKGKWPRFVHEANLSDSIDFLNAVFHQVCVEWDFIWIYDLKVVLRKSAEIIRHFCSLGKTHRALYILSLFASSCLQQADRYKGPILTQGPM